MKRLLMLALALLLAIPAASALTWSVYGDHYRASDGVNVFEMWNVSGPYVWTAQPSQTNITKLTIVSPGGTGGTGRDGNPGFGDGGFGAGAGQLLNQTTVAVTGGTSYNIRVGAGALQSTMLGFTPTIGADGGTPSTQNGVLPTTGTNGYTFDSSIANIIGSTGQTNAAGSEAGAFGGTGYGAGGGGGAGGQGDFPPFGAGDGGAGAAGIIIIQYVGSVTTLPLATIVSASPTSSQVPITVAFTDISTNASAWNWVATDVTGVVPPFTFAIIHNPTYTFTQPGIYQISLTTMNVVGSNSTTMTGILNLGRTDTNVLLLHMNGGGTGKSFPDSSYYANNVTNVGAISVSSTVPYLGNGSASTGGFASRLTIPNASIFALTNKPWTFSSWVNLSAASTSSSVIYSKVTDGNNYFIICTIGASPNIQPNLIEVVGGSVTLQLLATQNITSLNTWNHVGAGRYSNGTFWIETNGVVTNGASTPSSIQTTSGDVNIGAFSIGGTNQVSGRIDELALWNGVSLPTSFIYPQTVEFNGSAFTPSASFTAVPTTGGNPFTVALTDTSVGSPTSWVWQETNNSAGTNAVISTQQSPLYTFTQIANYTVNLTTTNVYGSYVSLGTFLSNNGPFAQFGASPTSGTPGVLVNFTFTGSTGSLTGETWNWSFGDTAGISPYSSTAGSVTHVYSYAGIFQPILWVNNSFGNSSFSGPLISVSTNQNQQNTWYTQKLVRIKIVDAYGTPLPGSNLTLNYISSTLPSTSTSWLISAFGISAQTANDMVNSGLAMQGNTSDDGSLSFMLFPALTYGVTATNVSIGLSNFRTLAPQDSDYTLYCPLSFQHAVNNTLTADVASSLPFYRLNATGGYNLSMIYHDAQGFTTDLHFVVKDYTHGRTTVLDRDWGNPGTSTIVDNFTVLIPLGQEYIWEYNATKV